MVNPEDLKSGRMKKSTFKLSEKDLYFLIQHVKEPRIQEKLLKSKNDGSVLTKEKYRTGKYIISFTRIEVELIVDFLSNFLTRDGLKANDEPNPLGVYIEQLIDIFNPYTILKE